MDPRLDLTASPDPADIALIERELMAFNAERALPYDRQPLCVFIRDDEGRCRGGLTGYTNWGWLYLDCFWLEASLRKDGLGSAIVARAEAEAWRRGCRRARLFTYSFQAQGFYERHGYTVCGMLEDYPPGHRQIFMRKDLSPPEPAPGTDLEPAASARR